MEHTSNSKTEIVLCELCRKARAFTHCLGCGIATCEDCACEDVKTSGCDDIWSLYFCPKCINDTEVNPDRGLKQDGISDGSHGNHPHRCT